MPFAVLGTCTVIAWSLYAPLKMHYTEARQQQRLEAELADLQERNRSLREQVDRLKTPEGVEEVARTSLGLVKEGENLYVVVSPDEATAAVGPANEAPGDADGPFWRDVLDLVFGVR